MAPFATALVPKGSNGKAPATSPVSRPAATSGTGTRAKSRSEAFRPWRGRMCFIRVRYWTSNFVTMPKRLPFKSAQSFTFGLATMSAQFAEDAPTITLSTPAECARIALAYWL